MEADDIEARVSRLLRLASDGVAPSPVSGARAWRLLAWARLLALCTSTAAALSHPESWKVTHTALEHVVEKLP